MGADDTETRGHGDVEIAASPPSLGLVTRQEFPHIRRLRDDRFPHEIAAIMPGEYFVSREPMIVYTVLGSCVSVCLSDPLVRVGGMNHFMLPEPKREGGSDSWGESARYGSFAMELLLNSIFKRGGQKDRLEVKAFGGGRICEGNVDIGAVNVGWVRDYLVREGLSLVGCDFGGTWPRKIYYFTESGRVLMKRLERLKNRTILDREETYAKALRQCRPESDVTLF